MKRKSIDLPAGCRTCRNGKLPFIVGENGATRCDCPRGISLQQRDRKRMAKRASEAHLGAPEHREALPARGEV
jgi:hypothetical protein